MLECWAAAALPCLIQFSTMNSSNVSVISAINKIKLLQNQSNQLKSIQNNEYDKVLKYLHSLINCHSIIPVRININLIHFNQFNLIIQFNSINSLNYEIVPDNSIQFLYCIKLRVIQYNLTQSNIQAANNSNTKKITSLLINTPCNSIPTIKPNTKLTQQFQIPGINLNSSAVIVQGAVSLRALFPFSPQNSANQQRNTGIHEINENHSYYDWNLGNFSWNNLTKLNKDDIIHTNEGNQEEINGRAAISPSPLNETSSTIQATTPLITVNLYKAASSSPNPLLQLQRELAEKLHFSVNSKNSGVLTYKYNNLPLNTVVFYPIGLHLGVLKLLQQHLLENKAQNSKNPASPVLNMSSVALLQFLLNSSCLQHYSVGNSALVNRSHSLQIALSKLLMANSCFTTNNSEESATINGPSSAKLAQSQSIRAFITQLLDFYNFLRIKPSISSGPRSTDPVAAAQNSASHYILF
jgi:hypothetical protein